MDGKSSSEKNKLIENVVNGIPFDVILSVCVHVFERCTTLSLYLVQYKVMNVD